MNCAPSWSPKLVPPLNLKCPDNKNPQKGFIPSFILLTMDPYCS